MSKSPINFGAIGAIGNMFGTLGNNQMINSLTNANTMAAQQAAAQQVNAGAQVGAQPTGSGMIMDPSLSTFNPAVQNIGMGIFGTKEARNRSLFPTPVMKHADEKVSKIKNRIEEIRADYEEDAEYGKLMEQLKSIEKEHEKQ